MCDQCLMVTCAEAPARPPQAILSIGVIRSRWFLATTAFILSFRVSLRAVSGAILTTLTPFPLKYALKVPAVYRVV